MKITKKIIILVPIIIIVVLCLLLLSKITIKYDSTGIDFYSNKKIYSFIKSDYLESLEGEGEGLQIINTNKNDLDFSNYSNFAFVSIGYNITNMTLNKMYNVETRLLSKEKSFLYKHDNDAVPIDINPLTKGYVPLMITMQIKNMSEEEILKKLEGLKFEITYFNGKVVKKIAGTTPKNLVFSSKEYS